MELRAGGTVQRFRLSIYKVTGSGRGRPDERRIEITTTYVSGMMKLGAIEDVVLGWDAGTGVFVGIDPRRLNYGGSTHNASSFFDKDSLLLANDKTVAIVQRPSALLGVERHVFVHPKRLAEYLFNLMDSHAGSYNGRGLFSGRLSKAARIAAPPVRADDLAVFEYRAKPPQSQVIPPNVIASFEERGEPPATARKLSPGELRSIQAICEANGLAGESFVFKHEKARLAGAGRADLAARVSWVSQSSVNDGFDIQSFETGGSPRFIEVKSTSGTGRRFPVSQNEWKTATKLKDAYWIYRVTNVSTRPVLSAMLQDPVALEAAGTIRIETGGWVVRI